MGRIEILVCLALHSALWLLLTWGAGAGQLWWPALTAAAAIVAACWRAGPQRWRVAAVIAVGVVCAFAVDGSLIKIRLVSYAGADPGQPVPPAWIIALWALFAAVIALPARKLLTSPVLAGVLGGLGGPAAYMAGRSLGAIDASRTGLIVVGVFFALATPVIVLVANRLLPVPVLQRATEHRPRRKPEPR